MPSIGLEKFRSTAIFPTLPETNSLASASSSSASPPSTLVLKDGQMIISRAAFIVSLSICLLIAFISTACLATLLYRIHTRHKHAEKAKDQSLRSKLQSRISRMAREIDDDFRRQFSGCLYIPPENPYLQAGSPVEMAPCERIGERPAVPPKTI